MAAIHEAGHVVAARRRRVKAYAGIWPSGYDDPYSTTWIGQTCMLRGYDRASDGLGLLIDRDGHPVAPNRDRDAALHAY
jgi:hypothetical protein